MSWLDQRNSEFIITTGDGKPYKPNWKNPSKSVEFNVAEFSFPNLAGTLVSRGTPKGRKYPLEIYFQGEDHLEISERFETSANDSRAWTVQHPLYGLIIVHPVDLTFDNTGYNISKITGTLLETITDDRPKTFESPADRIVNSKSNLNEIAEKSFAQDVKLETNDISSLIKNTDTIYKEGKKSIKLNLNAEEYFNLYNEATSAVLNATSQPLAAIRKLQAMIDYPSQFVDGVRNRVNTLVNQFSKLREGVSNITRKNDKRIYENNGAMIISSMAVSSVVPTSSDETDISDEYQNRGEVLATIEILKGYFDTYLEDLDTLQNDNAGDPENFVPDANTIILLSSLMNYTISRLFEIALASKQERSVILEKDSNIVLLAHRFYGLTDDDSTITQLMTTNNIGVTELLNIRKGRKIVYYV